MLEEYPQFEPTVFDVYKQRRPNNVTIINELLASETDIPSDATVAIDQTTSINVREVVQIGKDSILYHIDSGGQGDFFWRVTQRCERTWWLNFLANLLR